MHKFYLHVSLSLALSLARALSLSHSRSLSLALSRSLSLSLALYRSLSLSFALSRSLSLSLALSRSLSLSLALFRSLSLSLALSRSLSLSLALSRSHARVRSLSHILSHLLTERSRMPHDHSSPHWNARHPAVGAAPPDQLHRRAKTPRAVFVRGARDQRLKRLTPPPQSHSRASLRVSAS